MLPQSVGYVVLREAVVITHTGSILEYMHGTVGHILMNGLLRCTGDEQALFSIIEKNGFE